MPLTTGQLINSRYRVVKSLGQGGMGMIYRVWDINLQRPLALKQNFETTPEGQRQFQREATLLATLSHPNLPRVVDHFTLTSPDGLITQYLVMDYIEGQDLQEILKQRDAPFQESEALPWIEQICDALQYLHQQQPPIIHRDIKPANIKITLQGQAILVDFGIAKAYQKGAMTTVGAKAVTPGFSPIEQYGGRGQTDTRSDIYALGATLYTLLTAAEPPECTERVVQDSLLPARSINPTVSEHMQSVLAKALQVDPQRRFQSAAEFKSALVAPTMPSERPITINASPITAAYSSPVGIQKHSSRSSLARFQPWLIAAAGVAILTLASLIALARLPRQPQVAELPALPTASPAAALATALPQVSETQTLLSLLTATPLLEFTPTQVPLATSDQEDFFTLSSQPFQSGVFAMISQLSGLCMDVPSGTTEDIQLIQYGCHRGDNQAWIFRSHEDGSYEISSLASGSCLDVYYWGDQDGEMIYQAGCQEGDNQRWEIGILEDGSYQLKVRHSGKCLDIQDAGAADGQPIVQNTCNGSKSQRWYLGPIPLTQDSNDPPILEGVFTLSSISSEQCLDIPGDALEEVQLIQYPCHSQINQQWRFSHVWNTVYSLNAVHSDLCLDSDKDDSAAGAIFQAICNYSDKQMWDIRRFPDGSFQFRALSSGKCLAVEEGASEILQKDCNGSPQQRWTIDSPPSFFYRLDSNDESGLTMRVHSGQRLSVSAAGILITNNEDDSEPCNQWMGANGVPDCRYPGENPRLKQLPFMSLIGWLDGQWRLFGEKSVYDILQDGWATLAINDFYVYDNHGSLEIELLLEQP